MRIRPAQAEDAPHIVQLMKQLETFAHGKVEPGVEGRFKYMLTLTHSNVFRHESVLLEMEFHR